MDDDVYSNVDIYLYSYSAFLHDLDGEWGFRDSNDEKFRPVFFFCSD